MPSGPLDQPLYKKLQTTRGVLNRLKLTGRFGQAPEVAAAVCWLASEECSFTTAATLDTSGGRTTY